MNEKDRALLNDMLDFARRAQKRAKGKKFSDIAIDDYYLGDALLRPLEVIGEAANHITPEFQEQHSAVPWSQLIGMRNRLIHGYTEVNWNVVWEAVQEDIPELIRQLELILDEES